MNIFSSYNGYTIFEPIVKLTKKIYKCDKKFHLDYITNLYQVPKGKIGCVFVNGKEIIMVQIEPFNSNTFKLTKKYNSEMRLMSQTRRGGSSAGRYSRYRELGRKNHLSDICSKVLEIFFDFETHSSNVDILVICGPSSMKHELSVMDDIDKYFGKSLIKLSNEHFTPHFIIENVYGLLIDKKDMRIMKPQQLIETNPNLLIIGEKELLNMIDECNVKELYVSRQELFRDFSKKFNDKNICKTEIILIENSTFLTNMGGFIGIKYY